jgi:lysophospholipase L1-like esterase
VSCRLTQFLIFIASLLIVKAAFSVPDYPIVIHRGNGLANFFAKLNSGQSVTVAYIGGSVTQNPGWRDNVTNWLKSYYPGKITEVNAGWSGTGSLIGAMRYYRDVLSRNPDLVFIEFAVNDLPEDPVYFIERNCEGMVRQTWASNPMTDICFVEAIAWYNEPAYLSGSYPNSVQAHYNVCDRYGIPSVNMGWALYEYVLAGTPWESLTVDGDRCHPNAAGSQIYSDAVISYLNSERLRAGSPAAHSISPPLTDFPVTGGAIKYMVTVNPLPPGWTAHYNEYGEVSFVQSSTVGSTISITFTGPAAAARVVVTSESAGGSGLSYSVDGGPWYPANITVNGWTYIWAFPIAKVLANGSHTVTFKVNAGTARIVYVEAATSNLVSQNDAGSGTDAGNDFSSALAVSPGYYTGYVASPGDLYDYYKFGATNGQTVTCSMTPPTGADFDLYLYSPTGTVKAASTNRGSGSETITFNADSTGEWRLLVYAYSGSGTYTFYITTDDMNGSVPTGTNLARLASSWQTDSNYSADFDGSKAIDGIVSPNSKWCTANTSPPHWLALDLGATRLVNGYIVRHAGDAGEYTYFNTKSFRIQSAPSMSGPWTDETVVDNSAQTNVTVRSYNNPKLLRYVRLYITNPGIDNYARIPEFEVWGHPDGTPPTIPIVVDGGDYTTNNTQLHASWTSSDPESGIVEYQYSIGTTPGGTNVVGWTSVGTNTSVTRTGLSLTYGQMYYISVKAKNGAGVWSDVGISDGIVPARSVSFISQAKLYSDNTAVQLANKLVSAKIGTAFWIEEADRSSGIKVNSDKAVSPGQLVTVTGRIRTSQGERFLDQVVVVVQGSSEAPKPLAILGRFLGGTAKNINTPGVKDGIGLNNIGLLVRVWGRVTQLGNEYFYIDDGSSLLDGSDTSGVPNLGIRVMSAPGSLVVGDFVIVTGISTSFDLNGEYVRAILPITGGVQRL